MKNHLLVILFFSQTFFAQKTVDNWQLQKTENGISVYTKDLETTSIKELKAVFEVKASLSSLIALLSDSKAFPQWTFRCGQCETIKKLSETEFVRYQTVVAPWPVEDRDFVVHVKVSQDRRTKIVIQTVTSIASWLPEKKDFVRIKTFKGKWTLKPLKNGMLAVEYQLLVDPAGNLPAWLINMSAIDGPIKNAEAMKARLNMPQYKNASLPYIVEP